MIGFVVGPIVGCTIYDWKGGFYLVTYMTCALHLISIGKLFSLVLNIYLTFAVVNVLKLVDIVKLIRYVRYFTILLKLIYLRKW